MKKEISSPSGNATDVVRLGKNVSCGFTSIIDVNRRLEPSLVVLFGTINVTSQILRSRRVEIEFGVDLNSNDHFVA